ncbi:MAG: tetratricopeptide repeat protein [Acidobacteriaceae bacterium]|nr:tetratricopeptide repeat protein [Acidobacteriaceae bacterium]MBV8571896.1 tetratricopeptide repeat protein [Acidobacteriaceae bacterium]
MAERAYARGQQLAEQGHLTAAAEEFRKALLFAPENTDYRMSLATTLIDAGRLNEAQSHIEELLQEDPTNAAVNLLRAKLALKRNRLNLAIEYYQRAVYEYWPVSQAGQRRQARWELVDLLSQNGERSAVIAELMQLYSDAPQSAQERARIGSLLLSNGATSEALRVFQDLAHQQPANAGARVGLAEVYFASGDFISARHEYQHAERLSPHDHQITESLALTNEVIDMDPDLPSISGAERFRRSQNLLSRVVKDLRQCPAVPSPAGPPAPASVSAPASNKFLEQLREKLPAPLGGKQKTASPAGEKTAGGKSAGGNTSAAPTPAPSSIEQRLEAAQHLLALPVKPNEDSASELRSAAQSLWQDRTQVCASSPINDHALESVMSRASHE